MSAVIRFEKRHIGPTGQDFMSAEDHAHNHDHPHHAHGPKGGSKDARLATGFGAAEERDAAFSLLRLSAAQRLGIVLVVVLALWAGVRWALT
jgi:hypothetical protein